MDKQSEQECMKLMSFNNHSLFFKIGIRNFQKLHTIVIPISSFRAWQETMLDIH